MLKKIAKPSLNLNFKTTARVHPAIRTNRTWASYRRGPNGALVKTKQGEVTLAYSETGESLGLSPMHSSINLMIQTPVPNGQQPHPTDGTTGIVSGYLQNHAGLTLEAGAGPDPAGGMTAYRVKEQAINSTKSIGMYFEGAVTDRYYCYSVFVKAMERHIVQLRWWSGTTGVSSDFANYDLNTGEIKNFGAHSVGMENYANGWRRIWIVSKCAGTAANRSHDVGCDLVPSIDSIRRETYLGTAGFGIMMWGGQVEEVLEPRPNAIIPTNGSTVNCLGELFTIDVRGKIGKEQGAFYVEFVKPISKFADTAWRDIVTLGVDPYTTAQRLAVVSKNQSLLVTKNNTSPISIPYDIIPAGAVIKVCVSFNGTNLTAAINGELFELSDTPPLNSFTTMRFGASPVGDTSVTSPSGCIYSSIKLFNKSLDRDAVLAMTK